MNSQQEKKVRIKAPETTRANKPKIPISRIRQRNKDTFVVSRTSLNAANKNFEILKNNLTSASRRASQDKGSITARGACEANKAEVWP